LFEDPGSVAESLGLNRPEQAGHTIRASLARGRPRLFGARGLCAGYPLEPSEGEYFVAHEASVEKVADLRRALEHGLASMQLTPYTPDQDVRPGHILCKIAAKIQTSAFCIFDLPESENRDVYLELGIALGLGRPFILIKSDRSTVPWLVQGLDHFGFQSYSGLRHELGERIQVGRFSTVLPREAVPGSDTYLLADGEFEREDFREAVGRALAGYGLQPVHLAEGQVGPQLALTQLVESIQAARFGVYRIDERASANTFLALGIAIGSNKPWLLVAREGSEVPQDVHGLSGFNFRSFMQLETEFAARCRAFLQEHAGGPALAATPQSGAPRPMEPAPGGPGPVANPPFDDSLDLQRQRQVVADLQIDPEDPPYAAVHKLLTEAFSLEDLRRFCLERRAFRPVVARFGPGQGLDSMVDEVLDHCRTHLLWNELVEEVAEVRPAQVRRFAAELQG
jgi:hypothetical protein